MLAFPCNQFHQEPQSAGTVETCMRPVGAEHFRFFGKLNVNGSDAHPIYRFLRLRATPAPAGDEAAAESGKSQGTAEALVAGEAGAAAEVGSGSPEAAAIPWNFVMFLVSKDGGKVLRFGANRSPHSLERDIEALLAQSK